MGSHDFYALPFNALDALKSSEIYPFRTGCQKSVLQTVVLTQVSQLVTNGQTDKQTKTVSRSA